MPICCVVLGPTLAIDSSPGFCARRVQELGQRAIGRGAVDDDDLRRHDQITDRLETCDRIVIHLAQDGADEGAVVVDQQRVAVGRGACHRFGGNDAAGARLALDDHGLAGGRGNLVGQEAGQEVDAAARWHAKDDADCPSGLRPCCMIGRGARQDKQGERADRRAKKSPHEHRPGSPAGRLPAGADASITRPMAA